eukprot:403337776
MSQTSSTNIEKPSSLDQSSAWEDRYITSGFFNISSMAQSRILDKRKRKGLGPIKPREKNVFGQIILYGTSLGLSKTIGAPLERTRILMQTMHMQNLKATEKPSANAGAIISKITSEQGIVQLWRGNMANIYRNSLQMFLKIFMYDKVKNYFMPYSQQRYKGFDFFWRAASAASICTAITTLTTYPLDLIHTRIASDMTKKGQNRLFKTTFDCFNRTNLDEGRWGLYKGFQIALMQSAVRGVLTLPVYEMIKRSSLVRTKDENEQVGLFKTFMQRLGPSMISSLLISSIIFPLDTMKRCIQMNGGRGQLLLYKGVQDVMTKLPQQQGSASLYRGVHIFFINELIMAFAYISIYEAMGPKGFGVE